jgi:hypothetical protein
MSGVETGLRFTNQLESAAEAQNHNLLNGSGLAMGDYDGDGACDVFLCSLNGASALFRNLGGWRFTNVTEAAGLANTNWLARGAAFADVDGDGYLDLVVTFSGRGARLFLNDGNGHFRDSGRQELVADTGSTTLSLGDIDGDGYLDLYVANYGENTIRSGMAVGTRMVGGREQIVGRMRNRLRIIDGLLVEYGEPGALYRNNGQGGFRRISWSEGAFLDEAGTPLKAPPWDLGLTAAFWDINQDGFVDLYACNDFQCPDRIWLNNEHGQFRAIAREALRMTSHFSMAVDFADINGDGLDDFILTDMLSRHHRLRMRQVAPDTPPIRQTLEAAADRPQVRRNTLFLNRGDGTYAEIANFAGVANTDWSWTVNFMDVDLDGREDILIGTGHYYDTQDLDAIEREKNLTPAQRKEGRTLLSLFPLLRTPNVAFRNRGDLTFEEVGGAWGFDSLEVSHSIALADLDNDGDLDVVVNCLKAPVLVYRNDTTAPRVAVRLKGMAPNTRGIGARLILRGGPLPQQNRQMTCGGHYLSGDDVVRVFAATSGTNDMSLEVLWPNRRRSLIEGVLPNRIYEIDEGSAKPVSVTTAQANRASGSPWFTEVMPRMPWRHEEDVFDEFARQPLLPRLLTHGGPGVAWVDLNLDGRDDLVAGSSRGTQLKAFVNGEDGKFVPVEMAALAQGLPDDATGLVGPVTGSRGPVLLVGISHEETGPTKRSPALAFNLRIAGVTNTPDFLPALDTPPGPLALADVDGNGELALFVGASTVPGRYPIAGESALLRPRGDGWAPDSGAVWRQLGRVHGAVFTDLDNDGHPELVVACEWGSLRVIKSHGGEFEDVTASWGLDRFAGLWTGVAAGDFDGDGRMDLVAGNIGLNGGYQQVAPGPWHLYYGDYNGNGSIQIIEAYQDSELSQVVPWRQMTFLERGMPWLRGRFPTHAAFSEATVDQLIEGRPTHGNRLTVNYLTSILFLNRGGHFEARPLPPEAQWAPVFGITVADFDGDGCEDIFLSQNDYAVRKEDPPLDAGRGLLLRGDGHGGFVPLAGEVGGIIIYGEQRGCAVADFDSDGRTDLAVAEHNGPLHLYQNRLARPGLSVRLAGGPGNPNGIGSQLRLIWGERLGAVREIHAGSGYWSQDSARVVLATPTPPSEIEVRWPSSRTTRTAIPANATRIVVDEEGHLRNER